LLPVIALIYFELHYKSTMTQPKNIKALQGMAFLTDNGA